MDTELLISIGVGLLAGALFYIFVGFAFAPVGIDSEGEVVRRIFTGFIAAWACWGREIFR